MRFKYKAKDFRVVDGDTIECSLLIFEMPVVAHFAGEKIDSIPSIERVTDLGFKAFHHVADGRENAIYFRQKCRLKNHDTPEIRRASERGKEVGRLVTQCVEKWIADHYPTHVLSDGLGQYANTFEGDILSSDNRSLIRYLHQNHLALPTKQSQADWTEEQLKIAEANALSILKG